MVIRHIVLHCSDTEDGSSLSWPAIRRYHCDVRGWSDIGYHLGIEDLDGCYVLLAGRLPTREGAHCRAAGRNRDSLGVCVVGRYERHPPPTALMTVVAQVLATLALTYQIQLSNIRGHREWDAGKTCPGMAWDLDLTRALVGDHVRHPGHLAEPYLILGEAGRPVDT